MDVTLSDLRKKRWFDEVPGKTDEVWRYFLHSELLKAVLDADHILLAPGRPVSPSVHKRAANPLRKGAGN